MIILCVSASPWQYYSLVDLFLMLMIINMLGAIFIIVAAFLTVAEVHPAVVPFGYATDGASMNRRSAGNLIKEFFAVIVDLSI